MSEIFYISLTWGIVVAIVISLIAILLYAYSIKDNIQCWGESFIKKYPKQSIEILESNGFLKDDKSPKD